MLAAARSRTPASPTSVGVVVEVGVCSRSVAAGIAAVLYSKKADIREVEARRVPRILVGSIYRRCRDRVQMVATIVVVVRELFCRPSAVRIERR